MDDRKPAADGDFNAARDFHRQGRLAEAEHLYRRAIEGDAGHHHAKEWLGALCLQQGRLDEAIRLLAEAAAQCPQNAAFQDNLAAALLSAKRPEEAVAALERSVVAAPEAIETRTRLGNLLLQLGRRGKAMAVFEQAIAGDAQLRAVCRDSTAPPSEEERCTVVLENCGHILARYPNYAPAHYRKACALLNLGRIEEACRAGERALVLDPTVPAYFHILIHAGTAKQKASAVSTLQQLERSEDRLDDQDRSTLHFLLAKAYGDEERIAESFAHLKKANAVKRAMFAYDEARELGRMQAIAAAFTPGRLQALRGSGAPSPLPVFVLGMPRSGTTLVEQVLASHPDVHGSGEVTYLSDLVAGEDVASLTPDGLRRLGGSYVARLAATAPGAKRIVDKLPYNFLHVGLIHLALPGARIIHVKRDPLDTCFSCYAQTFAGDVGFAYDLAELGRYYRAYEALMAHWRTVLPAGAMLEVQYEDLVNDLPAESRRMVAYCGLEWDARCLDFHKSRRAVTTASLYQVRQPVYRSAVGRAGAYAAHLGPLREALGLS